MTDAPPAPPSAPPEVATLHDFPDRLPAVLVKELRQGLRAKMFVVPFVILHFLLIAGALSGRRGDSFFWSCVLLMLGVLLPSRNVSALSEERDARTLDTLLLTRLTPWRIVSGKWSATFALTLVTAVSIAPYLLMRYLYDGSSFLRESLLLSGLVLFSGAVTGIFTGLSVISSALLRNMLAALLMLVAWRAGIWLFSITSLDSAALLARMGLVLIGASWAPVFSLCQAAAALAPPGINSAQPRRTATAAAVAAALLLSALIPPARLGAIYLLSAVLVCSSLVEMSGGGTHPSLTGAGVREGIRARAAALLFHPGWHSGVLFSVLLWMPVLGVAALYGGTGQDLYAAAAIPFFAHVLAMPFLSRGRFGIKIPLLCFLVVQLIMILLEQFAMHRTRESLEVFLPVLPADHWQRGMTAVWMSLSLLFAAPRLVTLGLRNSRE